MKMKNHLFISLAVCAALCACKKDCEKDRTGNVKIVNTSASYEVEVNPLPGQVEIFFLSPGESRTFSFEFTPGDESAQISTSYKWEDQDTFLRLFAIPVMCETYTVNLVR